MNKVLLISVPFFWLTKELQWCTKSRLTSTINMYMVSQKNVPLSTSFPSITPAFIARFFILWYHWEQEWILYNYFKFTYEIDWWRHSWHHDTSLVLINFSIFVEKFSSTQRLLRWLPIIFLRHIKCFFFKKFWSSWPLDHRCSIMMKKAKMQLTFSMVNNAFMLSAEYWPGVLVTATRFSCSRSCCAFSSACNKPRRTDKLTNTKARNNVNRRKTIKTKCQMHDNGHLERLTMEIKEGSLGTPSHYSS